MSAASVDARRLVVLTEQAAVFRQGMTFPQSVSSGGIQAALLLLSILLLTFCGSLLVLRQIFRPELGDVRDFALGLGLLALAGGLLFWPRRLRSALLRDAVYAVRFDRELGQGLCLGPFTREQATEPFLRDVREPVLASLPLQSFRFRLSKDHARGLPFSEAYQQGEFDYLFYRLELIPPPVHPPAFGAYNLGIWFDLFDGLDTSVPTSVETEVPWTPAAASRCDVAQRLLTGFCLLEDAR